jgi:hypothetical protein
MGSGGASTDGGGMLCGANGWCRITNTQLRTVCPTRESYPAIQGHTGCAAVVDAWSGAVADTTRNRLGFAYDPDRDKMVGWAGGNTAYIFDVDQKRCEAVTHAGGPGDQNSNGTMGRFPISLRSKSLPS